MYISRIKSIQNYRNLSGLDIMFDEEVNFIVGENNIGKTNILDLLYSLISKGKFAEDDFYDIKKSISIEFLIGYSEDEIGYFADNFDIDDECRITILAEQNSVDDRIEYAKAGSQVPISHSIIKSLNLMYYTSLRTPNKEINFIMKKGTGKLLNYLVEHSLKKNSIDESALINKDDTDKLIDDLNNSISKINTLTGDEIAVFVGDINNQLINRILDIGDKNGRQIMKLGDGVQYSLNIFLEILTLIYHIKTTRKEEDFDNLLISKGDKKLFPIIITLDEPEIHQHPYRQRALIKSIYTILNNKDDNFLAIIKELFDVDGLIGQIFVVTHSPNILLNDYKQFIRMYKENENLLLKCGNNIKLDNKTYKHLLRSYLYMKEAMFSRFIVLVEGDTEYGAIPIFAQRLGLDLDKLGIGVVKLDGADGVLRCMDMLKQFGIKAIAIIDRDKIRNYDGKPNIYFTNGMDFEEDIYDKFKLNDYLEYNKFMDSLGGFVGILKKYNISINTQQFLENPSTCNIDSVLGNRIMQDIKESELNALKASKNAIKSSALAEYVTEIPSSFKDVILRVASEVDK